MNFIKAFFEDKARVGILVICLFMLCIVGVAALAADTYAIEPEEGETSGTYYTITYNIFP